MRKALRVRRFATTLALLASVAATDAVAGVVRINQNRVAAGGITAGDAPGFPVTLSAPGSYRLASNLTVPDADTTAIDITADNVTLDLSGFAILGPTVCSGSPLSCNPTGPGIGIDGSGAEGTVVVDGTVSGMGADGIYVGPGSRVERVRARSNGGTGIRLARAGTLLHNTATRNRFTGILVAGVGSGDSATLTGNTATHNGDLGISALVPCAISGNSASGNEDDGIFASSGSTVTENAAYDNGGDGIEAGAGSTVSHNSARNNTDFGLRLAANAGYHNDVLTGNNGGDANAQVDSGRNLGHNVCGTDTICP